MSECPACGFENLKGEEECKECQTALVAAPRDGIAFKSRNIQDAMKKTGMRTPLIVPPKTNVRVVLKQMKEKDSGCVLVVDHNQVSGIFTERDILHKLAKPGMDLNELEVQHVMTASPDVLKESDSIAYALNMMSVGNFRHVPVRLESGSFAVFSVQDALRYFF